MKTRSKITNYELRIAMRRLGFTLVELLIVAAILLLMTAMTVAVYSSSASADRIRTSARQVQSAFGGARDREIKAVRTNKQAQRGLRLLVDATDPTTVTSMVFVGSDSSWTDGQVMVGRPDLNGDGKADNNVIRTVRGWPKYNTTDGTVTMTGWKNLYDQGLLVDGAKMKIGTTSYTVSTYLLSSYAGTGPEILILTSDYRLAATKLFNPVLVPYVPPPPPLSDGKYGSDGQPGLLADDDQNGTANNVGETGAPNSDDDTDINAFGSASALSYELELKPAVLPGQEPLRLSSGIAIDLYRSTIPGNWYQQQSLATGAALPPTDQYLYNGTYYFNGWGAWSVEGPDPNTAGNSIYRQYSPRMDVMFSPSGTVTGPLTTIGMLHLRLAEVEDIVQARDPVDPQAAPMLYSTLFTQTGYLATFPVNLTDADNNSVADDPLYFARTGGTAGR